MRSGLRACLAVAVLLSLAPGAVLAQSGAGAQPPVVGSEPTTTAATYGDWILGCSQQGTGQAGPRRCEISQSIQVQGGGRLAQIVIGRLDPKSPLLVTLVLPNNVTLSSPVRLAVDEKDAQPLDLSWQRCLPAGCFANHEIKDDVLKRYRAQSQAGRLRFKDGVGRDVVLPFSFRGLAQALDALAKG